jgi:hypothetical protein
MMMKYRGYRIDAVAADAAWRTLVENPNGEPCPIATSSATRQDALLAASLNVNAWIASTPRRWS